MQLTRTLDRHELIDSVRGFWDPDHAGGYITLFDEAGRELGCKSEPELGFVRVKWLPEAVDIRGSSVDVVWPLPR